LFGQKLTPVGKQGATDNVLLKLADSRLAVVHLTWSGPGNGAIRSPPSLLTGPTLQLVGWALMRSITQRFLMLASNNTH
jgi:hypothetical protein